jgi:hypothetical protein
MLWKGVLIQIEHEICCQPADVGQNKIYWIGGIAACPSFASIRDLMPAGAADELLQATGVPGVSLLLAVPGAGVATSSASSSCLC